MKSYSVMREGVSSEGTPFKVVDEYAKEFSVGDVVHLDNQPFAVQAVLCFSPDSRPTGLVVGEV